MRFRVLSEGGEEEVVLKPSNGPLSLRSLGVDLCCTELACRLKLPCPEPFLVDVPYEIARGTHLRGSDERLAAGTMFATRYVLPAVQPAVKHLIDRAINKGDICGIAAFDTWVNNKDRINEQNILIAASPEDQHRYKIWMIDHDACLGGHDWTIDSLAEDGPVQIAVPNPLLASYRERMPDHWDRWRSAIAQLSRQHIFEAIDLIPLNWIPETREREAMYGYLVRRQLELSLELNSEQRVLSAGDK